MIEISLDSIIIGELIRLSWVINQLIYLGLIFINHVVGLVFIHAKLEIDGDQSGFNYYWGVD